MTNYLRLSGKEKSAILEELAAGVRGKTAYIFSRILRELNE